MSDKWFERFAAIYIAILVALWVVCMVGMAFDL